MLSIHEHIKDRLEISIEDLVKVIKSEKLNNVCTYNLSKKGKERQVVEVDKDTTLYYVQTILLKFFSSINHFPEYVFGFQKHKSYYKFLDMHTTGNDETYFLKLDIQNFFTSLDAEKLITNLVAQFEQVTANQPIVKELLYAALTYNNKIPQGFKTSPFLSNYYFFIADLRIKKYCDKLNIKYSRYADDMIFSSYFKKNIYSNRTIKAFEIILFDFNLKLNKSKTKLSKKELCLNGYVVSNEVKLSMNKLKELKRILFIIEQNKQKQTKDLLISINNHTYLHSSRKKNTRYFSEEYLKNYLSGYRSFLLSFIKENTHQKKWREISKKIILRIEKALLILYDLQ
ncbi:hypothetical protein KV69_12465 [Listeria monocytogenes]|nr:hypothetical protein [Listeria monocytogenes]